MPTSEDEVLPPPRRRKLKSWKIAATFAVAALLAAAVWVTWPPARPAVIEVAVAPAAAGVTPEVQPMGGELRDSGQ